MTLWSCRWDIFSREMNYISPVSPECTAGSLYLIWPWSNFISYSSLFSPVRYLYQISRKCSQQIPSPATTIKSWFFPSQLLLPFNQKLSIWNLSFPSFSGTKHIRPKLPIHQELCRHIPIGKGSWSMFGNERYGCVRKISHLYLSREISCLYLLHEIFCVLKFPIYSCIMNFPFIR